MSEQTVSKAGDTPVAVSPVQKQTGFSPATLNLQRMQALQHIFKYGAVFVFILFWVLIYFSYRQLSIIKKEIQNQKSEIILNEKKIDSQQKIIAVRFATINNFYKYADSVEKAKVEGPGITVVDKVEVIASQTKDPSAILPRIYLHIAREDQRPHAAAVGKLLEANGFIVPGIQKVNFHENSVLKCFEATSVTSTDTTAILKILRGPAGVSMRSYKLPSSSTIRPRHYEVWFGENFVP